jgi:thiamine-phosphate pyrophosphorylase
MASVLARAKLARAARRLNESARHGKRLPSLILVTDEARALRALAAARVLPRGAAILLRHRDDASRRNLATALADVAHARGLALLIAGDPALAAAVNAAGIHFSEARMPELAFWRTRQPRWLITAAAHSERALWRAARAGADAALLAPVFPTFSHPGATALGALRCRLLASRAPLPVYALGGVSARTAAQLHGARLAGLAAIDGLIPG